MGMANVYEPTTLLKRAGVYFIANIKYQMLKKNQNFIALVVGKSGSGKSVIALALANLIDPDFNIRKVCFSGKEYVNVLGNIKPCECMVWDETGVGLGSRDAMTKVSKNLSKVFQTMRFKRSGIIMTVPDLSMIDKTARSMVHVIIETKRIISTYKLSICRILSFKRELIFDKTMVQYPVIKIGKELIKIKEFAVKKPNETLMAQYEAKKEAFFKSDVLDKFNEDYDLEELKAETHLREDKEKGQLVEDITKKILDNPRLFGKIKYDGWEYNTKRIRAGFNIKTEVAEEVKAKLEMNEVLRLQAQGKIDK